MIVDRVRVDPTNPLFPGGLVALNQKGKIQAYFQTEGKPLCNLVDVNFSSNIEPVPKTLSVSLFFKWDSTMPTLVDFSFGKGDDAETQLKVTLSIQDTVF